MNQRVSYEEAVQRLREHMDPAFDYGFHQMAHIVWPDSERRSSQGSALALGRWASRMVDEGILYPAANGLARYVIATASNGSRVVCPTCGDGHVDHAAKTLRKILRERGFVPRAECAKCNGRGRVGRQACPHCYTEERR